MNVIKTCKSKIQSTDFLPPLPHVLFELIEAILSDKQSSVDLAKIVQKDPALSSNLLRVANSPFYGFSHKIISIPQAVAVLGWRAVQNIALTASVVKTFEDVPCKTRFKEEFWWHSLACSFSVKHIADASKSIDPDEAFVTGLLHDIGKLVLYKNYQEDYDQLLISCRNSDELCCKEKEHFGFTHADLGASLLDAWQLQPFLVDAVRYHHNHSGISSAFPLAKFTYLANLVAHSLFEEDPNQTGRLQKMCIELNFPILKIEQSVESIINSVSSFAESMDIPLRPRPEPLSARLLSLGLQDYSSKKEKELSGRVKDLALLLGLLREFDKANSIEEIAGIVMEGLCILFSAETAMLALADEESRELLGKKAFGTKADDLVSRVVINYEKSGGIWEYAVRQRSIVDSVSYFREHTPTISEDQIQNFLGRGEFSVIPLFASDEFVGMIVMSSLNHRDDFIQIFASHAAGCLHARMKKETSAELEELKNLVLEKSPAGLMVVNDRDEISYANPSMFNLLGISKEVSRIPSKALEEYWHDLKRNMAGLSSDQSDSPAPFLFMGDERNQIWLQGRKVALNCKESLVLFENVTQAVNAESVLKKRVSLLGEMVEKKTRELEEKEAELIRTERIAVTGRMARKIAHEINNPLGIIKNYLQIALMRMDENSAYSEPIRIVQEEIDRIAAIVRKLSEREKTVSGKIEKSEINQFIKDLTDMLKDSYKEQNIEFILDLSPVAACANVGAGKLKQVFLNVFKNAAEAMPAGGQIRISTTMDALRQFVTVEIRDTGTGISPEVVESIFEPHFSTKGFENSGLGLSVCREILNRIGGAVSIKNSNDRGTTFSIRIPTGTLILT